MDRYVGSSKKDIENLIESVREPGISVRRERRIKRACAFAGVPNIVYHFSKGGQRLFSICVAPNYDWENIEMSIMCDKVFSDPVREGDDAYRKAYVLYQLAEKMYEVQCGISNKSSKSKQSKVFCEMFSRIR